MSLYWELDVSIGKVNWQTYVSELRIFLFLLTKFNFHAAIFTFLGLFSICY